MTSAIKRDTGYGIIPFLRAEDNILFLLAHEKEKSGFWTFPKGHAENNEDPEGVALRELQEEAGVTIDSKALIRGRTFHESYFYTDEDGTLVRKLNTFYLGEMDKKYAEVRPPRVDQGEFDEARLLPLEEALKLPPKNTQKMLRDAHTYLTENYNL